MLSNELPLKSSNYPISPFKKVPNIPPQIPKYNYYNDTRQIFHPNTPQEKLIQTPVQFGVNVYFGHHKYFSPPVPLPDPYLQNNQENIPICILFKNSLAKSGYKLTPEQSVLYKDTYKKHSSINSFYDNFNFCPINNNNNIINNIYPTFTKVTNVQILSDNESAKVNEKEIDTKKENINSINKLNTNRQINLKNFGKLKREEIINQRYINKEDGGKEIVIKNSLSITDNEQMDKEKEKEREKDDNGGTIISDDSVFNISKRRSSSGTHNDSSKLSKGSGTMSFDKKSKSISIDYTYSDDEVQTNRRKKGNQIQINIDDKDSYNKKIFMKENDVNINNKEFKNFCEDLSSKLFGK